MGGGSVVKRSWGNGSVGGKGLLMRTECEREIYATEKVCSGPCTVSGKRGKEGEGLPIR